MRASAVLGLALASGLALSACGASEDDARKQAFCDDVPGLLHEVTLNVNTANTVGGQQAIDILSDQIDKLEKVEPPADVADEWTALVDSWTSFRDLLADAVANPPDDPQAFQTQLQPLQQELTDTGAAVDEWGQANC